MQRNYSDFFGYKVGHSVLIGMKLELDLLRRVLDVNAISKHVEKKFGKL